MPARPYPTLSEVGLVHDPEQKMEWIFADYIAAKHSQSTLNYGLTSSLSFDEFQGNYEGIRTAEIMQTSLTSIFEGYFDTADFQLSDDSEPDSKETRIRIKAVLTQDGKSYYLNDVLAVNNGRIRRLSKFN